MSIVGGCVAGVLGLTGLAGFIFYIVIMTLLTFGQLVKTNFNVADYFIDWNRIGIVEGVSQGALSYVLFWTYVGFQ